LLRLNAVNEAPEAIAADDARPALERPRTGGHADEATLTAIYEERRAELFGFLLRMTRDPDVADDILQDTFIRLIQEARAGRMPDEVRAWLYRVAANAAISRGRRGQALHRLLPRLVDRREPVRPESEALRVERADDLGVALAELAPDGRAALVLAAQGFTGREIADSLGRTEGATRTLMCRARIQVRHRLEAEEGMA
jgi:RNA polymerase sigma-70 factor (ECF subfamily)